MIETIVIRNIKRDHSDKPIVALSETKFEKEESYQCNENICEAGSNFDVESKEYNNLCSMKQNGLSMKITECGQNYI